MKKHFAIIDKGARIACGVDINIVPPMYATTKVDSVRCKKCLKKIQRGK